jgi:predicted component of type VI protein secretion system
VATYANTVRPLGSIDPELRYLILDDLDHVVTQVKKAATVLEKQDELADLSTKLDWFGIDPDLQSDDLEIECITTVDEFWETHQVERNVEDAAVGDDLEGYLGGEIQLSRLFDMLQSRRKSIVPQVDAYDAEDDTEALDDDLEYVKGELTDAIDAEEEKVAAAKDELAEYRDRIPGESSWLRRGQTYLDNCETELESSPAQFDHEQYGDYWEQWETARSKLEEEAFGEEEFEETVRKYDPDIEIDVIEDATEDGLSDKFSELDDDEFQQVIDGLRGSTTAAEELKQSLLKIRVKAELTGDGE